MFYTLLGISVVKQGFVWLREEVVMGIIRGYVAEGDLCGAERIVGCRGGFVGCCIGDLRGASGGELVWCRRDLSCSSGQSGLTIDT